MNIPNLPSRMENKTNKNAPRPLSRSLYMEYTLQYALHELSLYCLKTDGQSFLEGADVGTAMMTGKLAALPGMVHLPSLMLSGCWGSSAIWRGGVGTEPALCFQARPSQNERGFST